MAFISNSSYIDHLPPQTSGKKKNPNKKQTNKQSIDTFFLFFFIKSLKTTLKHLPCRRKTHNYRHRQAGA